MDRRKRAVPLDAVLDMTPKNAASTRRRRLACGILTSSASKFAAIAAQLLVLPMALHALGTGRYAAFLALQAFLSWTSVFGFGLTPALPRAVAAANTAGDKGAQRDIILSALLLVGGSSLLLGLGLVLFGLVVPPWVLVSAASTISHAELWSAYLAAIAIACCMLIVVMQPAIRSGYQQLHYANLWAVAANLITVALLLTVGRSGTPDIGSFNLMANGPIIPVLLLDLALLFWQRPYLLRGRIHFDSVRDMILHQSTNALAVQVAFMLFAFFPIFAVSKLTTPLQTAQFASMLQPMLMAMNGMNLVFQPMVSAFADAHSHRDIEWLKKGYRRFLTLVLAVGGFSAVTLVAIGPLLFRLWLHADIGIDRLLCASFACYFMLLLLCNYFFNILSAVGQLRGLGRIYLLHGIAGIALGALLTTRLGPVGMTIGLASGMAGVALYQLPRRVKFYFRNPSFPEGVGLPGAPAQPAGQV